MNLHPTINNVSVLLIILCVWSCEADTKWKGQKPIQVVPTNTLPVQKQYVGTFDLGNGIFASNEFDGARLNGIVLSNDTLITALITPENTPINQSPWYAFNIWAESEQQIQLKLIYLDGMNHRYYPKLSFDGINWKKLDDNNYFEGTYSTASSGRELPVNITMKLTIGPDTLWISAQELITSNHVNAWINKMDSLPFVSTMKIGESREGRAINLIKIGNSDDQKMIFVLSRQHPPEVTGYLAMQSFVETIASENETAAKFREIYNTYVVPLANPDGVDNGNWRHNAGGVDLNRDWENVNQPEIFAIQKFMKDKVSSTQGKFYFGVDFHSTWEDIYYTITPDLEGNMPGLVPQMIKSMSDEIEGLDPNIQHGASTTRWITSSRYFFHEFGAESLTYEIGDNTPRDLLKRKGEVSAMKLMELMIQNNR